MRISHTRIFGVALVATTLLSRPSAAAPQAGSAPAPAAAATAASGATSPPATAPGATAPAAAAPGAAPAAAAAASPSAGRAPRRDPLPGGPFPALFVVQAQFEEKTQPDGKKVPVPGYAKLMIVRRTPEGWKTAVVEDPDSNVFHKAMPWDGGLITIGATRAMLKTWKFEDGKWKVETRWNPTFGGKFDRLRDLAVSDVDGDGKQDLVIATHDQGVIAVVHPEQNWKAEEIDREPRIFVHEVEVGDVDGDGKREVFATPSKPNTLEKEQSGEVRMYRRLPDGKWHREIVDAPGDTHAKEIMTADVDGDGTDELYIVWEGAIGAGGTLVRPVTIKQYRMKDGKWTNGVVATIPDRQMRSIAAGDVNGDGKVDIVAGGFSSGLWLLEQQGGDKWKSTRIEEQSSGFEHPVYVADLDGDGALEIYVGSEDQGELRQYVWKDGKFEKKVVARLENGDITWNITSGKL